MRKVLCSSELFKNIKSHSDNKMLLRVERNETIDKEDIIGFPISVSEKLLLMSNVVDFHDEGYLVVRMSDIVEAYSLESDAFYEKICSEEGLKTKAFNQNTLKSIADFKDVLNQLLGYPGFISISCDLLDSELYFSIGQVVSVEDEFVEFKHFTPDGIWESNERKIPIEQITSVAFGDNYSKIYFKYMSV